MFLDDVQVGPTVHWDQYHPASPSPPPPVNGSTAVSILDTRHLAMIFDTGTHNPMTVYAVSVWQACDGRDAVAISRPSCLAR